eukprot:CAMPEP_0204373576 /NCGR_PEP_ID=MMETSP0469-20131031/48139_1 /ASSEMBLY_ACC=CAM_ASM_000384 /TAXON_ID=2969 /ORGANISM="Oxyrrhis marina" /LENGTH=273 /DNA_ID=CAMNT_0051364077 /DNA_START=16 /DNA_END=833 /DNA_ORIENTATION=+
MTTWQCPIGYDWTCFKPGARKYPGQDECGADPNCIFRHKGFTEVSAGFCGPLPAIDEVHNSTTCLGGAMGELRTPTPVAHAFDCTATEAFPPMKTILLVTDGKPKAPGYGEPGCPSTPGQVTECLVPSRSMHMRDALAAALAVKGDDRLNATVVGVYISSDRVAPPELYAMSSCCGVNETRFGDRNGAPDIDRLECATTDPTCPLSIAVGGFDELVASTNKIVETVAQWQTTQSTCERATIPVTQLAWLLLLAVPSLLKTAWGWTLVAVAGRR